MQKTPLQHCNWLSEQGVYQALRGIVWNNQIDIWGNTLAFFLPVSLDKKMKFSGA